MACLKDEMVKAESSLLQAASSSPLYGRAHCITAVLQHINTRYTHTRFLHLACRCCFVWFLNDTVCVMLFRSLVLLCEWRTVVSELIALCYRMSDVVSPVVQSSSPEGLIPMDTDSGKYIPRSAFCHWKLHLPTHKWCTYHLTVACMWIIQKEMRIL